jgi:hypothetical protein
MNRAIGALLLLLLLSSAAVSQGRYPRLLDKVDLSQVRHSVPGVVPANSMKFDPLVDGIIHQVNLDSLVASVRILSGEDSVTVGTARVLIRSRGGQEGGDLAAEYLKQRLSSYNLEVFDQAYSTTGRNIYAKRTGYLYPEKEYIICAHYDAVAENSADDNASGTAGVLEAARILSKYDPKYTVVYAFWDEEEQGLIGSDYYASQASSNQEQIQGVINMDMIAWDGNNDYLADIHTRNNANSNDLANLLVIVNYLYDLPVKPVIYNPGTWQSDHSSFWNHGFGATLLIEAYYGGDLNPYYHTNEDNIAKFNLPFFHGMSELSIATLSTLIEVTKGPVIVSVAPDTGYQSYSIDMQIKGLNTHFVGAPGTTKAWLSKGSEVFHPDSIRIDDSATLHAYYSFPLTLALGSWNVNVQTTVDSIITRYGGLTLLPPPPIIAVSPESLSVTLAHGETKECYLTITNAGSGDLCFRVFGSGRNYALQFDGVDGMVVATANGLPLGNSNRTIELWFWRESQPWEEGTLVGYGNWGQGDQVYEIFLHPDHICFSQWGGGFDGKTVIQSHQWYHAAVVNNGNDATLYLNGQDDATGNNNISTVSSGSLVMGKAPSGYDVDRRFNGVIDDVRIWNYARTQSEIESDMHRELSGTEPGLVGYWPLNDSWGSRAYDVLSNHNHGLLTGGVTWVTSSAPIMPLWLSTRSDSGLCLAHSSIDISISIDGTRIDAGNYYCSIRIATNDPFHRTVSIPVHLEVLPSTGVRSDPGNPKVFSLAQNYPNPFNPTTVVSFQTPVVSDVRLVVYDILGREVAVLVNEKKMPGKYQVSFDAAGLASGVYVYRLTAGQYVECRKMVVTK